MRIRLLPLLLLSGFVCTGESRLANGRNFDKVRLNKEGYEKVHTIHYNWYLHSLKAIMGQMGKEVLPKLDYKNRRQFLRCLNAIADKRDIVSAARCLIEAKEHLDNERQRLDHMALSNPRTRAYTSPLATEEAPSFVQESRNTFGGLHKYRRPKPQRRRLSNIRTGKPKPTLKGKPRKPLNLIVKNRLTRGQYLKRKFGQKYRVIIRKVKAARRRHRSSGRVKRSLHRLVTDQISKSDSNGFQVVNMRKAPSLVSHAGKSVVSRVTRLVKTMVRGDDDTSSDGASKWANSYKSLLKIKKSLDESAKQPGAKVYDFRMFDLVLDNDRPTKSKGEKSVIPPIVEEAYKLIHTFEGKSKEVGDSSNIKFLSPRFASIMPDKADVRGSLSPSILSFYKDDTEDQLLPIPKLLEATGMTEKDREDVLEMIMETAGARQIIDDATKMLSSTELFGMKGELQEVTERMIRIFKNLEETFDPLQQKDLKKRGFTFLETNQLDDLHKTEGLAEHAGEIDFDIHEYGNQTRSQREQALWLRVAEIAANGTKTRSKRQIEWLLVGKPTILSPYMFTPILGFSVLGPVVLSPSLFSPLLLNPAVLSPYVLSPAVGMPFILSPYLLSPYVLSPLIMAPFILNPYVLSPNVINPYVLSPLILSPLVLCPDLVSPMVLGGSILSPGVLSPSVFSKSFLMVSVLSPTVLS